MLQGLSSLSYFLTLFFFFLWVSVSDLSMHMQCLLAIIQTVAFGIYCESRKPTHLVRSTTLWPYLSLRIHPNNPLKQRV